tara:strand:+ start:320 stop:736 length:417 start_codon:yes stop_codon:yes gene_type:complete
MSKLTTQEKTKVIYFTALQKTKKLKTKISNLEYKYLEEAIVVMNLISALKEETYTSFKEGVDRKEYVARKRHELWAFEEKINKLRTELDENNTLLMRSCIESEDIIKFCLEGDWEAVQEKHVEFDILTKAIRKIEGTS